MASLPNNWRQPERRCLCALFLVLLAFVGRTSAQETPDTPEGFYSQFQQLFKAYQDGDEREFSLLATEFAIPAHWFPQVFGVDQGEALVKAYAEEFSDFAPHVLRNFQSIEAWKAKNQIDEHAPTYIITVPWLKPDDPKKLKEPAPALLVPLPRVEKFDIQSEVSLGGAYRPSISWMDSFVYIDGKFRFFGRGSSTFWKPAKIRRADPCARPGQQTGGLLVVRIDPVYPADAWNNKVEGFVKAVLTVDKTGLVKNVEIVEGHPLLVDAAKEAFKQWQYTPFMNCGQPVEMNSFEHVKFSIPQ